MIKRLSLAAFVLAIAACTPPAEETPTQDVSATAPIGAAPAGCFAEASRDWSAVGSQYYVIEAEASGANCGAVTATIRITTSEGAVLFERPYPTSQVSLAFAPNSDQSRLREELDAWTQNTAEQQSADWLPAWPARADRPPNFQPAEGVTRQTYEAARGNQSALFCYPDGGESNACVALAGTTATLLGSLTPERL
jgi:hypothetical protein